MANSWQQITKRLASAFAGAYDTVESVANATGATLSKRPPETEATEYEQIAARVEWIAGSLDKINDALAADETPDTGDESTVDATVPAGPTTRRKAGRPAAQPQADQAAED